MPPHPTAGRLQAFAVGTTDAAETVEIVTHLEGCPGCCDLVETATGADRFVSRLRQAGGRLDPWAGDRPEALGGYRIEGLLGRGGMGTVYLARDERVRRTVAVKVMRPDMAARPGAADRFLREARSAARVDHDHVVPIWHVGEDGGVPFLVMPLLRGESLADRLAREPVAPPELVRQVGREVADGLAAAHAAGLVHRDIKPANIWLDGDPDAPDPAARVRRCRVLDFGLARPADAGLTAPGLLVGSPGYMAPEQARGGPLDARTDLFSLGAVLYRMATGRPPFPGPTVTAVLSALATEHPAPPGMPPGLSRLVMRLLAKNPADRPGSAREVADALRALADPPARRTLPRRVGTAVALVAALAAVAAAVVIKVRHPDGKETTVTVPDGSKVAVDPAGVVTVELPKAGSAADDRRAVEWVLAAGGKATVRTGDGDRVVATMEQLPAGPLALVGVQLIYCNGVNDAGLARLSGLTRLEVLNLDGSPVSDAGVRHLTGLTGLTFVNLSNSRVTDAGLRPLARLTGLREVHLVHTRITGAGLEHLTGLPDVARLYLHGTRLDDADLALLGRLPNLTHLSLIDTPVTDAGLPHLGRLVRLVHLDLHGTKVTDAGMTALHDLRNLRRLNVFATGVTPAAAESLRTVLPNCVVVSAGR